MRKSNVSMGEKILTRFLMMPCAVFFRNHLRSASSIALFVSGWGIVDGLGDAL